VNAEAVYPAYVMCCTALILIATATRMLLRQGLGYATDKFLRQVVHIIICTMCVTSSPSALWSVIIMEVCKLGCLIGMTSTHVLCSGALLLSYSLPFLQVTSLTVLQSVFTMQKVSLSRSRDAHTLSASETGVGEGTAMPHSFSHIKFTASVLITGLVTAYSQSSGLIHAATDAVFMKDTPWRKELAAITSVYSFYISLLLLVYYPTSTLRRYFKSS
jgi:hypothetical protein